MRPHHERAIKKLVEHFERDETCLAVIVGGSVAKGLEREDSDIDVMLVLTEEAYRQRWEENALLYFSVDFCDYPGGYIDGKYVSMDYLRAAAERGNEPTRVAFTGAILAHSKVPGLEELVRSIPVYQPQEQQQKIQSFYAQLEIMYWYVGEALKRDDKYMRMWAVSNLVLFGGRLILAHNQVLYPFHKFLLTALEGCPEKPEGLMELIDALLSEPNLENATAFYKAVKDYQFWNKAIEIPAMRYMKDVELTWLTRTPYIGDA